MIRRRLTVLAVAALTVALAVVTAGFYVLLSLALENDARAVLQTRLEAAMATVTVADGGVRVSDSVGDETLDATTWVLGPGGELVLSPTPPTVPVREINALAGVREPTTRDVGEQTRLLAAPVPNADPEAATVVVSLSLLPYETTERAGLAAALVLDAVMIVLLAILARWLVGSALRPVDEMTRGAHEWAEHDVDRRFAPPVGRDDEIGRLGTTLNDLLARLDASLRHERRLTDEIAHELRTPLTRARMEAELATASQDPDELRAAMRAIMDDIDELAVTVDTLMDAARLGAVGHRECDLTAEVAAVVAAADPRVPIDIALPDEPLAVTVDPAVVRRILSPQIENAVRHAVTAVRVTACQRGPWVTVEITDDGPGVPAAELDRVFRPGERGETSEGLGLGLALARRLARAAGGEVHAEAGPGGRFRITLPAPGVQHDH